MAKFNDPLVAKNLMHHAGAVPEHHVTPGLFDEVGAEVFVGCEDNRLVFRDALDDRNGIGAGATNIGEGFEFGGAVDVADHDMVGVFFLKFFEQRRSAGICQRAACF